ncbi:MAG: nitroreductase [Lachnospiraceae bacterium]|nr:nitroreductase [Lachnospiraceae bacterium]
MNNEVLEAMKTRRSIRAYEEKQITREEVEAVTEAGTYAASGMGRQSAQMVVVQDPETVALLSKLNAQVMGTENDPFYGAPTVVVVFADPERPTYVQDGSLVIGNLLLAAHTVGLGSCWIHRAKEVFSMPEGKALMKKWGVPEQYVGIGHCILGYIKGEAPKVAPRKEGYVIYA